MPRGISLRSGKSALPSMNVCGEVGGTVGMAELDSWNGAPDVWSNVRVAGQGQGEGCWIGSEKVEHQLQPIGLGRSLGGGS